ncbi:thiol:disulfide interchange protein TlpA [Rhodopseudomonas julia]|uniref:thiol:disulfide interchange protein TlpA n=1 Tax=Rhodopseudomonas julia TaxID=200617 RepID=UPI003F9BEC68
MTVKRTYLAFGTFAVIVLGFGLALYGISGNGNDAAGEVAANCQAAVAAGASLDPVIGGEVAAFIPASQPQDLSALTFTGADGSEKRLADLSGRLKLVNLWATWCAPCREEMPALDALEGDLGSDDFSVVPINIDTSGPERPRQFLNEIGVEHLPLLTDKSMDIFNKMKAMGLAVGLPVTALVDGNGCLVGHMNGPAEWNSDDGTRLIKAALDETAATTRDAPSAEAPAGS